MVSVLVLGLGSVTIADDCVGGVCQLRSMNSQPMAVAAVAVAGHVQTTVKATVQVATNVTRTTVLRTSRFAYRVAHTATQPRFRRGHCK